MDAVLVKSEQEGGALVMTIASDHLDAGNSALFRAQSAPFVKSSSRIVLDLAGVTFIDSSGLGALLSIMRTLGERGGDFRVCAVARPIRVLFELVRLHKILDIHETRAEALAAGAGKS